MRQERPLISVIVPVYNVERYVEKCLNSILAQTYPNIELILVDDASTDKSGFICDGYAMRDPRVRTVHFQENRGPSAARNEGVRQVRGTYASFVDADDCVEPDLLEKLYQNLIENEADISICGADGINLKSGAAGVYSQAEAVLCLAKGVPFNLVPWGKLYNTELLRQSPFDEQVFYSEDLLFLYLFLKRVQRVSYMPDALYHYTHREGSQVQSGVNERKCTALFAQDFVCRDSAVNFPEAEYDFHQLALEANRCLAVLAVKKGASGGRLFTYLKRIQENTRRHFSRKALGLCPRKKDAAAIVALCVSVRLFYGMVTVLGKVRQRTGGR